MWIYPQVSYWVFVTCAIAVTRFKVSKSICPRLSRMIPYQLAPITLGVALVFLSTSLTGIIATKNYVKRKNSFSNQLLSELRKRMQINFGWLLINMCIWELWSTCNINFPINLNLKAKAKATGCSGGINFTLIRLATVFANSKGAWQHECWQGHGKLCVCSRGRIPPRTTRCQGVMVDSIDMSVTQWN